MEKPFWGQFLKTENVAWTGFKFEDDAWTGTADMGGTEETKCREISLGTLLYIKEVCYV